MLKSIESNFEQSDSLLTARGDDDYMLGRFVNEVMTILSQFKTASEQLSAILVLVDTRKLIVTFQIPKSDQENIKQAPKSKRFKKDLITVNGVLKEFACQDDQETDEEEQDEVAEYWRAKLRFSSEENVLLWWKKQETIYPQLRILAQLLLSIPASSVTAERIFSNTGRILEARRERLNPDSVDAILFLRNFRK
ncbi:unnamed protein product [Didymodactylos carnosus]|uniref:HAT C-terminal dimerisation domain-containing protein n=1 Tax=Didymodactylos carnosus TaxID=1234261 RepID=A0A814IWF1_9BILA|nr:unnamed protein product [Didymodactylos carnosus]CAF1310279.1 unnamed protein product [Didymodactylos carnosus]CAF3800848.1 unnamed protein product [Didymodactylos carnosus]CAF4118148.1 unnamed protein product [Didymodactylos carnosus]